MIDPLGAQRVQRGIKQLVAQTGRYSNYLDKLKVQTDWPPPLTLVAPQQRQDGQLPFALRRPQS